MENVNILFRKTLFLAFLIAASASGAHAQDKESTIKNIIEARQFVFHAQTALPTSGASRQLTSDYDLKVSKNSVISYLPFFGRAYSLPYGTTEGGFNFTSTKFDYAVKNRKKGGWEINIKPKDVADFREFLLTISESGYGTLQALTNNRQPISFTGYITPIK
jgi:hypothetical protein